MVHTLSRLYSAGVLERGGARVGRILRVSPRFLAHAEATAAQRGATSHPDIEQTLEAALAIWDEFNGDVNDGARLLRDLLEERGQLGALRPVFPALERFAPAAA